MLRIDRVIEEGAPVVLKVHGRLIGPWVEELRQACERVGATAGHAVVDLEGVSFVDREGVELLRTLASGRFTLRHGSAFVVEQLRAGRS